MKYRAVFVFMTFILAACANPSPKEAAVNKAEKTQALRQGQNSLAYGQSIDKVHELLLDHYEPVMDFHFEGNTYFIDRFRVYYPNTGSYSFLALYTNGSLSSIAPSKSITTFRSFYTARRKHKTTRGIEEGLCYFYTSNDFFQQTLDEFKTNKTNLKTTSLNRSEEDVAAKINELSEEQPPAVSGEDAVHFAAMSPILMFALPMAVASAPVTLPAALAAQQQIKTKDNATAARIEEVRSAPMGISFEQTETESENVKLHKLKYTRGVRKECPIEFGFLIKPNMNYKVEYFANEDGTFKRYYEKNS